MWARSIPSYVLRPPASVKSPDLDAEQKILARKALRRKKKRLRKLREKVRLLRAELFHESNAVDQSPSTEDDDRAAAGPTAPTSADSKL